MRGWEEMALLGTRNAALACQCQNDHIDRCPIRGMPKSLVLWIKLLCSEVFCRSRVLWCTENISERSSNISEFPSCPDLVMKPSTMLATALTTAVLLGLLVSSGKYTCVHRLEITRERYHVPAYPGARGLPA